MDTKQPTTEWPTSVNKDITNTLEDEPFNEESEDTLLYKNVSVTPRKTKKNNKVYWITSPPSVALKRVVNESIGKETSDINVAQVVDWIHNKHTSSYDSQVVATSTTSTTSTATTSTTSMTTTTDATRHSSWERLSLSSPTSSSPNRRYSHSSSKKFRYHSPESVQKMFNLIDQMEESKSSTVTTTITTTTPTKSSTTTTLTVSTASTPKASTFNSNNDIDNCSTPTISRIKKENAINELLDGDLLFLNDDLLLSEDDHDTSILQENEDKSPFKESEIVTTTTTIPLMTPSILSSNNTLTTSINHHSLRPSLIDSDLHEIEDIMTAVNDDVFNDNDLLVSEDIPLEDNLKNEDQLLNDIDFSQWSDEENDEAKVDSGNTGIPVEIPTGYKFLRGMIEECNEQMYYDHHGRLGREKILKVKFTQLSTTVTITGHVHLRDDWFSTPIRLGTYIHLNGPLDERGSCMVDNQHSNIVIIHPDLLISNTQLSDSFICQRRSTLQGRIRVSGQSNTAMTYGLMLHELLQRTLQSSNFSDDSLNMCINELIQNNLESLYYVEEDETMAEKHLKEMLPNLKFWMSSFLGGEPREYVESMTSSGSVRMAIRKVLDIEEGIWSPSYGIKGVIDASLEIVHTTPSGYGYNRSNGNEETVSIVPLEVKTGRASNYLAHQAQTLLYTLLMSDRYDQSIDLGLLYYLKSGTTKLMSARDNEIRGLLITRNELADYLANTSRLPPLQKNAYKCQRCFAVDACAIYHRALEKGTQESFGVEELFDERTRHLTEEQTEFLRHWDRLVTMEEQEMNKFKGEIWSMSSRERESVGRCIGGLIIDTDFDKDTKDYQRQMVSRYRYRFIRSTVDEHRQTTNYHNTNVKVVSKSFLNSHITIGDPVVISTEHGQIAMAIGFVLDMNEEQIVVGIDRSLNNRGSLLVGNSSSSSVQVPTLFRLDKDELSSGMATLRYNLVRLFTIGGCDQRRRALIVDLAPPSFKSTVDDTVISSIDRLNSDQQAAINKVLTAKDYALLLGMPGSGKTTTIAQLIRVLVEQDKRVLVTSYTHSAVDTILMKLKETHASTIVRLGNLDKIHQDIRPLTPNYDKSLTTVRAYEHYYASKQIFAATCLGIHHPALTRHQFDYCIVDEASQLTLPATLGPIQLARVFVLIGDHYQLPPTVIHADAAKQGLSISLFQRLSEAHPAAQVILRHQYRMNRDIMKVSNHLIYNNQMICGSEQVAEQRLDLPNPQGLALFHSDKYNNDSNEEENIITTVKGDLLELLPCESPCWLEHLLDPVHNVILANTDTIYPDQTLSENILQNYTEAHLVHQTVEALIQCGIIDSEIGIITPYRSQVRTISLMLKDRPSIEVYTVDRYQGRDKDCILLSLVRTNTEQNVGHLLRDWRRMNVAFTRARKKLIIFGSVSTLEGSPVFAEFVKLVQMQQWIYPLPTLAHRRHDLFLNPLSNTQPEVTGIGIGTERRRRPKTSPVKRSVTLGDDVLLRRYPLLRDIVYDKHGLP